MIRSDYHTHTSFCDGRNTPEEMVQAAVAKGMECIGFSGHALTSFDTSWCMSREGTKAYVEEISRLKEAFRDQIRIYCGAEVDYYSDGPLEGLDYTIGSVHYIEKNGSRKNVDESPEFLTQLVEEWYGGDFYAAAEAYYANVADVLDRTGADIIGHFDLITKFNEGGRLFDESHPRYRAAWQQAADRLLEWDRPFEINTGAMFRGWRTAPYPSAEIMDYIAGRGGRFILSGDAHSTEALCWEFDRWERYVNEKGYELVEGIKGIGRF